MQAVANKMRRKKKKSTREKQKGGMKTEIQN